MPDKSDPAHAQQQEDRDEILNIMTDLPLCLTNSPHNSLWINKKSSIYLTLPRISFLSATAFTHLYSKDFPLSQNQMKGKEKLSVS